MPANLSSIHQAKILSLGAWVAQTAGTPDDTVWACTGMSDWWPGAAVRTCEVFSHS